MSTPMRRVNEIVSAQIGNTMTNIKTWGSILVNVKEYGAEGDGVTDDTLSITAALSYISDAGGGTVYFPIGTYVISNTLVIPSNTYVLGAGIDLTSIVWEVTSSVIDTMIELTNNSDSQQSAVSDLTLDHKRSERGLLDDQSSCGIIPQDNVDIDRVRIINTIGPGISSTGLQNVRIRNCEIYDTGHHNIYFSTTHTNYVKNIEILNNYLGTPANIVGRILGANFLKFRFSTAGDLLQNIKIKDNLTGSSIDEQGIFISTTSGGTSIVDSLEISGNIINPELESNTMLAIIYIGTNTVGNDVVIENNLMYGSNIVNSFGMRLLFSDTTNTKNVVVAKNNIQNVEVGIDPRKALLSQNTVTFSKWGIAGSLGKAFQNTLISSANSAVGIRQAIMDMVENVIVLTGSTTIGIDMGNSTNLTVNNNTINGATQGILRDAKSLTGCAFTQNVFIACAANYVNFTNSAVTMQNNQFEPTVKDQSGATANRPTALFVGQRYFDSTLNKPIWWNGTNWVDATGTTV